MWAGCWNRSPKTNVGHLEIINSFPSRGYLIVLLFDIIHHPYVYSIGDPIGGKGGVKKIGKMGGDDDFHSILLLHCISDSRVVLQCASACS